MSQPAERPFVGRTDALLALREERQRVSTGLRAVLLAGPAGSGRKRLVGRFLEEAGGDALALRLAVAEGEDGVRTLLRLFGTVVAAFTRTDEVGTRALAALESPAGGSERERAWCAGIAQNARRAGQKGQGDNLQIQLPRDNPWLAVLAGLEAAASAVPVVLELQDVLHCTSPAFWAFLATLVHDARERRLPILLVLSAGDGGYGATPGDGSSGPATWFHDLARACDPRVIELPPFSEAEVDDLLREAYRPHQLPAGLAARVRKTSGGLPGRVDELLAHLEEEEEIAWDKTRGYYLDSSLDDLEAEALVPLPWEGGEDGKKPDPKLRERMERVLHAAALEGEVFTAGVLADALGLDRDDVDDALDEMPGVVTEVQYVEPLSTWLYRFHRAFYRDWYVRHPPGGKGERGLAERLADVMVRSYAPASFEYLARAARLLAEAGERRRAQALLPLAITSDRPEVARFGLEILEERTGVPWPAGLASTAFTGYADRAVLSLADGDAEDFVARAERYAERSGDTSARDFAVLLRARLVMRKGELEEGRRLAREALKAFEARKDAVRQAEAHNQLAVVALHMRDLDAARRAVDAATKASNIPPVRAHTAFVRGLLLKAERKAGGAADAFRQAAELALQTGNLLLALEGQVNSGEMLLVSGKPKEAARVLRQARAMTRGMRVPRRDRGILLLLSQAEAAAGNSQEAYDLARETLQMTRELGLKQVEHADLYHCGLFGMAAGQEEAQSYFKEAARLAKEIGDKNVLREIQFNHGQLLLARNQDGPAVGALEEALVLCRETNDRFKASRCCVVLGMAHERGGRKEQALARFREALAGLEGADHPQIKEERRRIEAKVKELSAASA